MLVNYCRYLKYVIPVRISLGRLTLSTVQVSISESGLHANAETLALKLGVHSHPPPEICVVLLRSATAIEDEPLKVGKGIDDLQEDFERSVTGVIEAAAAFHLRDVYSIQPAECLRG